MNLPAQSLMWLARFADLYRLNRLEFWCYDQIIAHGWEGLDTFIRMELFDD